MFYDTEKRQVDLRIRLKYDGMNQSDFFRAMITGYLEKDIELMTYLDRYKEKYKFQGIHKRNSNKRLLKKGKEIERQFVLDDNEIENIFDLLEEENPDL